MAGHFKKICSIPHRAWQEFLSSQRAPCSKVIFIKIVSCDSKTKQEQHKLAGEFVLTVKPRGQGTRSGFCLFGEERSSE